MCLLKFFERVTRYLFFDWTGYNVYAFSLNWLQCVLCVFEHVTMYFLFLWTGYNVYALSLNRLLALFIEDFDQPALRAIRVLRPLKLVTGFESKSWPTKGVCCLFCLLPCQRDQRRGKPTSRACCIWFFQQPFPSCSGLLTPNVSYPPIPLLSFVFRSSLSCVYCVVYSVYSSTPTNAFIVRSSSAPCVVICATFRWIV